MIKFIAALFTILVGFLIEKALPFLHMGGVSLPLTLFLVAGWVLPLASVQRVLLVLVGGILLDATSIFSFPVHTLTFLTALFLFHSLFLGTVDTKSRFWESISAPCFVSVYFSLLLIAILSANRFGLLPEISSTYPSLILGTVSWVVTFLGASVAVVGLKHMLVR